MNNRETINKFAQLLNAGSLQVSQTKDQQYLEIIKLLNNSKQRIPINRPTNIRYNNISTNL